MKLQKFICSSLHMKLKYVMEVPETHQFGLKYKKTIGAMYVYDFAMHKWLLDPKQGTTI